MVKNDRNKRVFEVIGEMLDLIFRRLDTVERRVQELSGAPKAKPKDPKRPSPLSDATFRKHARRVMAVLDEGPPPHVQDIAEKIRATPETVRAVLQRLIDEGLVASRPAMRGGRIYQIPW